MSKEKSILSRRRACGALLSATLVMLGVSLNVAHAQAKDTTKELRIGFQKSASLLSLLKSEGVIEKRLSGNGVAVKWIEFPAGPQLLEGLNVGSIDVGFVGEAPPIFAQAAGADFLYIGFDPAAPQAEGVLVPKDSPIKSVADLKGKKIALNKGSNVHYLLVKLLEKNGLKYSDVTPVFLPPADARAAFERGAVDAWVIWDPFQAAAEKQIGARLLADGTGLVNNYAFYLASRKFVEGNGAAIDALFDEIGKHAPRLRTQARDSAEKIAAIQGLPPEVVELSLRRYQFGVQPVTPAVLAEQQKVADTFFDLKLIPKRIDVRQAAWQRKQ